MFDLSAPKEKPPSPDITEQTIKLEEDPHFPYPVSYPENKLVPRHLAPPASRKIRVIFLTIPEKERILRLPVWLHELVGWGVFLVILVGFLTIQIYLNRLLSGSLNQLALCLTVVAEMSLLWRWDQFWY